MACDLKLSHNDPKQVVVGCAEGGGSIGRRRSDETRSHKVPQGQTEVEEAVQHVDLFASFLAAFFCSTTTVDVFVRPMSRLWNLSGAVTLPGSRKTLLDAQRKGASKCKDVKKMKLLAHSPGSANPRSCHSGIESRKFLAFH